MGERGLEVSVNFVLKCKLCFLKISYSCLLSDGPRKGRRGKSRAKSGQSWINWNVHRPCEAFVKNILKYIEYIDRPCEDSAKINYKKTIILIWHISDLFWAEHRGHNLASWLLPNQSDHSTRAKVLHPPHAGEEQKRVFFCDLHKHFSRWILNRKFCCRSFPWFQSQPSSSRTVSTWTLFSATRTGSPP